MFMLFVASPLAATQAGSNSHWLFALLSEGEGEGRDGGVEFKKGKPSRLSI